MYDLVGKKREVAEIVCEDSARKYHRPNQLAKPDESSASRWAGAPSRFVGKVAKEKLQNAGFVARSCQRMRDPVVCTRHNPEFR